MRVIGARRTKLEKISNDKALAFVKQNHRQGLAKPGQALRSFGLLFEDEIVAVALFCNPRTRGMQKRYTTELFRMAFKPDVRIQGGASKLIKAFLATEPWDLFTYQDTNGEATSVYEHAGMTLVTKATPKEILLRDGIAYEQAEDNRRDWFSLEQASKYGPDSLLNTKLGEVFRDNGVRKSNIDLFIEELSYQKVLVPGDNVYEWRNPNVSFYTYKITSANMPGYYIGRRVIRKSTPTEKDCLNDGYMGSAGTKFKAWKSLADERSLSKEILGIFKTWDKVIKAEHLMIGDSYKDDPLCVNIQPGGMGLGSSISNLEKKACRIHDETFFNGKSCMKCSAAKIFTTQECHIHGSTQFRKDTCEKCNHLLRVIPGVCENHGDVKLLDGRCIACQNARVITEKDCEEHGFVLHFGDTCATCMARNAITFRNCKDHGVVKHQGNVCSTCNSHQSMSSRECIVHGKTKHQGLICMKCNSLKQYSEKFCKEHGLALHKGDSCAICTAQKAISVKYCTEHGLVNHQGAVCSTCHSQKSVSMKICTKGHGLTKHQGDVCNKCNSQKSVTMKWCDKCEAETKHQGQHCSPCQNRSLITMKECATHGAWKHRGNSCYACVSDRRRAKTAEKKVAP